MRSLHSVVWLIATIGALSALSATVREVPDDYPQGINAAINDAVNGDTISVWGEGDPPYYYYENVNFLGKGIFVVNRSFLPNQVQYDSSWDHV